VLGLDLPHRGDPGLLVGHVKLEYPAASLLELFQTACLPRRRPDREPAPNQGQRGRAADARK
jgi:hypothetical protein